MYIIIGFLAFLFFYCIFLNIRLAAVSKKRKSRFSGNDDTYESLEKIVLMCEKNSEDIENLKLTAENLKNEIQVPIKKVGLSRYDMGDTGGKQSFSLALLNDNNEGIILRGLFSRDISRLYCIKVDADGTDRQLQEEDLEAFKDAIGR